MKIKVCGLTAKTDLDRLVAIQPHFMGFIFYPGSKRFINSDTDVLSGEGIQKVGVFVNASLEEVMEAIGKYELHLVQLHGDETPEYCQQLKSNGVPVIKAFAVDEEFQFETTENYVGVADYFLFDTKGKERGGNGYAFNWNRLDDYHGATPFFLSGGISLDDVDQIKSIDHPKLFAVDINSRFEISPGEKDLKLVEQFIKQIEQDVERNSNTKH